MNSNLSYIQFGRPSTYGLRFTLKRQGMVFPRVVSLFFLCAPFAISIPIVFSALFAMSTRVITVIVDTVYRMFIGRGFSHIFQEIWERIPSRTHTDTTCAVPFICPVVRICASTTNAAPNSVYSGLSAPVLNAILPTLSQTSTTTGVATLQSPSWSNALVAAGTKAHPERLSFERIEKELNSQLIKNATTQICKTRVGRQRVGDDILIVGHLFFSPLEKSLARLIGLFKRSYEPFSLYHTDNLKAFRGAYGF